MKTTRTILLVCILSLSLSGCRKKQPPTPSPTPSSTTSPADPNKIPEERHGIIQVIASRWTDKTATLAETALAKEKRDKRILSKVVMALSEEETAELINTMTTETPAEGDAFEQGVLGMLVRSLWRKGDRQRLVSLLTVACPREVGPVTIEYSLAVAERTKRMPDAFTVLVESYHAAKNQYAKATLLTALSDALPSLREEFAADDAFVQACADWHQKHRGRFKLSSKYVFAWQDHRFTQGSEKMFIVE